MLIRLGSVGYIHADREVELTYQLQMQALEYAPVLVTATELVAELDWYEYKPREARVHIPKSSPLQITFKMRGQTYNAASWRLPTPHAASATTAPR